MQNFAVGVTECSVVLFASFHLKPRGLPAALLLGSWARVLLSLIFGYLQVSREAVKACWLTSRTEFLKAHARHTSHHPIVSAVQDEMPNSQLPYWTDADEMPNHVDREAPLFIRSGSWVPDGSDPWLPHHFALRLDPNGSQQETRVRITTYRGDPNSGGFPKRTTTLTQTPVSRAGFHMGASVSESISLSWVFWGNQKEKHFGRVQLQRQPRFLEPQDTILQFHTTPCADFQRGFCAKHGARGKAGTSMFSGNEGTPINYPLWFSFSPTSGSFRSLGLLVSA